MSKAGSYRTNSSELPFKSPFFYGWIITGISAVILFFSGPGQTYSVSAFIDHYIAEFGWSRSLVSSLYSMGTLTAGLIMGMMGGLFDRWGHRIMTTFVALLLGVACLGMSLVNSLVILFIGFFAIRLLGQGSMSLSSTTLPPQWFITKKGRALSIASLGGAVSTALLPPLNTWLILNYGWRFGWRFWAILLWCVMVPIAYLFIRDRPEDVGLWPDNKENLDEQMEAVNIDLDKEEAWTAKEAMSTRSFWFIIYCIIVPSAIVTALIFHQFSVMSQIGLSPKIAALVLSSVAIVYLPIVLIAGPIADRVPPKFLLAISEGGLFVSIVVLLYTSSLQMALVYGILLGGIMGVQSIVSGFIWPEYFGRRYLAGIRGITLMAGVIGSAIGPLPFGYAYDLFGGYQQILFISMIFPILGIVIALLANPPKK